MSCACSLDELLAAVAPVRDGVDAWQDICRAGHDGLLSIGLKLHCLGQSAEVSNLVERLGGKRSVVRINSYRSARASLCLVLPPVGGARAAILLLDLIGRSVKSSLFGNPQFQIQICSPGRLNRRHASMLAIAFYLGSDTLRRYSLAELETTFSKNVFRSRARGRRLVLYDEAGDFDRHFEWWEDSPSGRVVQPHLPIKNGRTDVLAGSASRLDIENVNLIATLLMHLEYGGYWRNLGSAFEQEMVDLLERHLLLGLLDAPWIRTNDRSTSDDQAFFAALQELMAYAFEEAVRVRESGGLWRKKWREVPARASNGILYEIRSLLQRVRFQMRNQQKYASGEAG